MNVHQCYITCTLPELFKVLPMLKKHTLLNILEVK